MSSSADSDSAASYWRARLSDAPPTLEVVTSAARSTDATQRTLARRDIDGEHGDWLASATRFLVWVYRSTRQADLVVNAVVDGRALPLRIDVSERPSFERVRELVERELAAARAQGLDASELLDACGAKRFADLSPIAVTDGSTPSGAGLDGMELVFTVASGAAHLDYDAALFDAARIENIAGQLALLDAALAADPTAPIGTLAFLTPDERARILVEWNAKEIDFPRDACLHELFEERAIEAPDAIAAKLDGQSLTYAELDAAANQLAHHLIAMGVGPDTIVGVSVERSFEMVVGLVGLAKAGGAYLPMDPAYPKERLAYMLADSGIDIVLTQKHLLDSLPLRTDGASAVRVVLLDADAPAIRQHEATKPEVTLTSDNLAYVIYTSGSTGAPKGVVLNHQGRVNNFLDFNRRFDVQRGDALIALASLSFDMCAYDVFGTLAAGSTIVLPQPGEMQDPAAWARILNAHDVTVWHTAPAMLKMLVEHVEAQPQNAPKALRLVLLGGDWIPVSLPDRLRALVPNVRVISMGGATECSMDSTIFEVERVDPNWKSIPYGEPMANQRAYVLDDDGEPLPVGVPGELFLGGIGVGRGYLDRPELTAERFLPDPFWTDSAASGVEHPRMYRTGDLARWMPDGNLELLGRLDNQVKIRGYRIELGEIEARLASHPGVKEGVIVARDDASGEKRLMAYVIQDPAWTGPDDAQADAGSERVEEWQAVYDNAYAANANADEDDAVDPTFNIVSWDSSYTNEPIPEAEMRLWVEQTVSRIARHAPEHVLEIGCGMGLLLFRIAPDTKRYIGSDFSKVALEYVRRNAARMGLAQVELESRWADNFDGIAARSLDSIVLNSIILDFPSMDYLMDVLRGSVEAVRDGGVVFVGDVRNLPLIETYQTSVQLFQADDGATVESVRARVQRLIRQEEELVIDPAFFEWLVTAIPRVSEVRIQLKRGDFTNELNAFRYDVTIFVGAYETEGAGAGEGADWTPGDSLDALRIGLVDEPERWSVRGVPNARVIRDVRTRELAAEASAGETVAELRARVDALDASVRTGVDPEAVWKLAGELGYAADIRPTPGDASTFDVAFLRGGETTGGDACDGESKAPLFPASDAVDATRRATDFANNPTMGKLSRQIGPEIKRFLTALLPDYMVPSVYVPLDAMPLSPNGKVDRKRLPEPDTSRPDMQSPFVEPSNPTEQVIAAIWVDVLGLDRVGVEDAFLDLGGHSILAVQIQARINEILPFDLSLPDIFESRTVARLAELVRRHGRQSEVDADEVCSTILMIEGLSDDEIDARIRS